MYCLAFESLFLGTILGRFFKFPILVPVYVFAIVLALINPSHMQLSLISFLHKLLVFIVSLQIGYFAGALAQHIPGLKLSSSSDAAAKQSGDKLASTVTSTGTTVE
jgi:hypothetical protein